ncbi:hypothetical protein [[Scytonema hofmanni] UTEX B 1581]|nr:hypothetical protein [[Scytonema hofmanni] UTEX B 1581]
MKKLCKIDQLTGALPPRRGGKSSWNGHISNPMQSIFDAPMPLNVTK